MHVAWSRIRLTLHALLERGGRGRIQRTQHTHRRAGYSASLSFVPVASALADPIIRNPAILGACQADVVEGGVLRYTQCGVHASGKQWTLTVECNQRTRLRVPAGTRQSVGNRVLSCRQLRVRAGGIPRVACRRRYARDEQHVRRDSSPGQTPSSLVLALA